MKGLLMRRFEEVIKGYQLLFALFFLSGLSMGPWSGMYWGDIIDGSFFFFFVVYSRS